MGHERGTLSACQLEPHPSALTGRQTARRARQWEIDRRHREEPDHKLDGGNQDTRDPDDSHRREQRRTRKDRLARQTDRRQHQLRRIRAANPSEHVRPQLPLRRRRVEAATRSAPRRLATKAATCSTPRRLGIEPSDRSTPGRLGVKPANRSSRRPPTSQHAGRTENGPEDRSRLGRSKNSEGTLNGHTTMEQTTNGSNSTQRTASPPGPECYSTAPTRSCIGGHAHRDHHDEIEVRLQTRRHSACPRDHR